MTLASYSLEVDEQQKSTSPAIAQIYVRIKVKEEFKGTWQIIEKIYNKYTYYFWKWYKNETTILIQFIKWFKQSTGLLFIRAYKWTVTLMWPIPNLSFD